MERNLIGFHKLSKTMKIFFTRIAASFVISFYSITLAAQTTETFEGAANLANQFVNNSVTFTLTTNAINFYVANFPGLGYNGSAKFIQVDDTYSQIARITAGAGKTFYLNSLWLYITGNATQDPGVTSNGAAGSITFRGKRGGVTQFTVVKNSAFVTNFSLPGNGFGLINFATQGGVNNTGILIDQLEIELSANYDYFAIDNLTITHNTSLPVSLIRFDAKTEAAGNVLLNWSTAWEQNNDYFLLERSTDNQTYIPVAKVPAAQQHAEGDLSYTYADKPASGQANYFYRLSQYDKDGQHKYLGTRMVSMKNAAFAWTVFPNPVERVINIWLPSGNTAEKIRTRLMDRSGKVVADASFVNPLGKVEMELPMGLPAGVYTLAVEGMGAKQVVVR